MASAKPYRREPERQDARRAVTGEYRALKQLMMGNQALHRTMMDVKATVEAPRETEIVQRDSQGMPVKSISRVLKGASPTLRLG